MTETQAKSGNSGAPTKPGEEKPAEGGTATTGRAAVGRAIVPGDAPSPPKFTRAPGMTPPPDEAPADEAGSTTTPERPSDGSAKASASVPMIPKGKQSGPGATAGTPAGQAAAAAAAKPSPPGVRKGTVPSPKPAAAAPAAPGVAPAPPGTAKPDGPAKDAPAKPAEKQPTGAASGSAAVGAARVSEAVRPPRSPVSSAAARGPRRARLNLKRIDPWSVMKFSFAVSVVLFIVVVVATAVLYLALDAMGVWDEVNNNLTELVSAGGGTEGNTGGLRITAWGVIGTSMLIGAVNVVLFTALATLGAFIYNVCADLVGGVELTLAERD